MNRLDLQSLSRIRTSEAKALLDSQRYAGSYYLMGYAVECAIKAVIAKQTRRHDFPNKKLAQDSWQHDLPLLLRTAGLWTQLESDMRSNRFLNDNWAVVKDWTEAARYNPSISDVQARDLHAACTARKHGILRWLKRYW